MKRILALWGVAAGLAAFPSGFEALRPGPLRVGAAASPIEADDSMVIGGGIGPGKLAGQEGRLQATAVVIEGNTKLCLVAVDALMMNRDLLDEAARRVSQECRIPPQNVLINASHSHHAPSTATLHGYRRDELFCRRAVDAIVRAAVLADRKRAPSRPVFRLGQEATVGQNSRQLLKDGQIYWIGPRDGFVRPTGPFDPDLPALGFLREDGAPSAWLFSHSTHCIGTRAPKRSPGFYGLAAQELSDELGVPVAFFSGAAGSTHNLTLACDEMVHRIKTAFREAAASVVPLRSNRLAAIKREFSFRVRHFDEDAEDRAVSAYCRAYAPQAADFIIQVFREMRAQLRSQQGETRRTWLQAMRIGDVYLAAVPAELFTSLGLEIKRRSPHRYTFVLGLCNDYAGYVADREAYQLGGYQTWTGLHSFVEPGTGEAMVEEAVRMLEALGSR